VTLWADIDAFSAYGFNKSHAVSYSVLTYWTAYLKTHYPVEFMCALLSSKYQDVDRMISYIFNCRELGIQVKPPDINISELDFCVENDTTIRFGLAAIKNLGTQAAEGIIAERKKKDFDSLVNLINRTDTADLNRKKLDSLILSGAFDFTKKTRAAMLDVVQQAVDYKRLHRQYQAKYETYQKKAEACVIRIEDIKLKDLAGIKHRLKALKDPVKPELPPEPSLKQIDEFGEDFLLQQEKELLGFYISGHPIAEYEELIKQSSSIYSIEEIKTTALDKQIVTLICIPTSVKEKTTKKTGKKMASIVVEDITGAISVQMFSKSWEEYGYLFRNEKKPIKLVGRLNLNETSDGDSIVEIIGSKAKLIGSIKTHDQVSIIEAPLNINKIEEINNIINQHIGGYNKVKIVFKNNEAKLMSSNIYKIKDIGSLIEDLDALK